MPMYDPYKIATAGHSDAATTLNVYAKAWHDAEGDAAAIEKVEALLRS